METLHRLVAGEARSLPVADASVQLVVTSPPYPMISMWDEGFCAVDPEIAPLLAAGRGFDAYERMHLQLDEAWAECVRALIPGGWIAVNVGDATRSIGGGFALYPNHARITMAMIKLGMTPMPDILWRKPTNAPNKFMGSGMLPAGAYVTYEHEYVGLYRKGASRPFSAADAERRRESAFFWEERNRWFSDLWEGLPGERQGLDRAERSRSAAFPVELPYRLIQMYSLQGDTVLDPFVGTGTTLSAAVASGRNSVGVERDALLAGTLAASVELGVRVGRERATARRDAHREFVAARLAAGKTIKHVHASGVAVMTGQEMGLRLRVPTSAARESSTIRVAYTDLELAGPGR
ncbi:DNA modification methylase [Deltaproteobacteria bacterium]|nr:DNA modification methylase [Deltaproteobacteria bacterium]